MRMNFLEKTRDHAKDRRAARPGVDALEGRRLLSYNLLGAQWSRPARVTFSIMPDGTNLGGVPSNLQATLDNNPATAATWRNLLQKAAAAWENFANVNLVQVADDGSPLGVAGNQQNDARFGDIRIGGHAQDPTQLAFAFAPPPFNGGTNAGDIFFNTSQTWNSNGNPYDFYSVALHEFGHALGLGHEDSQVSSVMWPVYTSAKSGLSSNDRAGINAVYGPIPKDLFSQAGFNGSIFTASDVTSYLDANNQVSLGGLTLTRAFELHYFKVTVPASTNGTMTVSVQASNLSSVIPAVKVFDGNNNYTGYGSTQTTYSTTASVTMTGVQPGQVYKFLVNAGTVGPGANGTYGLQINLGGAAQGPVAPPDTTVAQQPDTNPGTYPQGVGWLNNNVFVRYAGDMGWIGQASGGGDPGNRHGRGRGRANCDPDDSGHDEGLWALHFDGGLGYGDALRVGDLEPPGWQDVSGRRSHGVAPSPGEWAQVLLVRLNESGDPFDMESLAGLLRRRHSDVA